MRMNRVPCVVTAQGQVVPLRDLPSSGEFVFLPGTTFGRLFSSLDLVWMDEKEDEIVTLTVAPSESVTCP